MPKIETIRIPQASLAEIEGLLLESFRWSRDHKGDKYRHAIPCEWCVQHGLLQAFAVLTGGNVVEMREEYRQRVAKEKKPTVKKRVVKKPVKKVVRRVKK